MTQKNDIVDLSYRYDSTHNKVQLTGIQALLKMLILREQLDRKLSLETATFVSGYPGSPIGSFDTLLLKEQALLNKHNIFFRPGVNEEIAATSIMGSQLANNQDRNRYNGICGLWFGKAPGIDRALDAVKHANYVGAANHGGVLAIVGDDPNTKSSTLPGQSEPTLMAANIPVLYPCDQQDVIELGVKGFLLSRYTGSWIGFKFVTEVADGGSMVDLSSLDTDHWLESFGSLEPNETVLANCFPPHSIQREIDVVDKRLKRTAHAATKLQINKVLGAREHAEFGIIVSGKNYLELLEALSKLNITKQQLAKLNIRIFKLGMVWPLIDHEINHFVSGLSTVLVLEDKKPLIEDQLRIFLQGNNITIKVIGKRFANSSPLLPLTGALNADLIFNVLSSIDPRFISCLKEEKQLLQCSTNMQPIPQLSRSPYFCSGCPHNRSTVSPAGSLVGGGIGCHTLSLFMDRNVQYIAQMGGEGAAWLGMEPFVKANHIFQHVGDGTYFHSASLSLRAAVAAGSNITYKILFNGTIAMTGGQKACGGMAIENLVDHLLAEGVNEVALVAEYPDEHRILGNTRKNLTIYSRDELMMVQQELRNKKGVSVIIYDQQCALDKRRQRKLNNKSKVTTIPYVVKEVCEGCGDCASKSNCLSLGWEDTWDGRKVSIQPSTCNFDQTCIQGECPSFLTILPTADTVHKQKPLAWNSQNLPQPVLPDLTEKREYKVVFAGVGGTGVVTINAILAQAAQFDGVYNIHLDQTGMAQKGGAVISHLILSNNPIQRSAKITTNEADLILGFDCITAMQQSVQEMLNKLQTKCFVNSAEILTAAQLGKPTIAFPNAENRKRYLENNCDFYIEKNINLIARNLFNDETQANMILVGIAYQAGSLPLSVDAIERAITLNGVSVERNIQAFSYGRSIQLQDISHSSIDEQIFTISAEPPKKINLALEKSISTLALNKTLSKQMLTYAKRLVVYQSTHYAYLYINEVKKILLSELISSNTSFSKKVIQLIFKVYYIKDEYEVARLLLEEKQRLQEENRYGPTAKVYAHVSLPKIIPFLGDGNQGHRKTIIPENLFIIFAVLKRLKVIRNTRLDPFRYRTIRKKEKLALKPLLKLLHNINYFSGDIHKIECIHKLVESAINIRGYGSVREAHIQRFSSEATASEIFTNKEEKLSCRTELEEVNAS